MYDLFSSTCRTSSHNASVFPIHRLYCGDFSALAWPSGIWGDIFLRTYGLRAELPLKEGGLVDDLCATQFSELVRTPKDISSYFPGVVRWLGRRKCNNIFQTGEKFWYYTACATDKYVGLRFNWVCLWESKCAYIWVRRCTDTYQLLSRLKQSNRDLRNTVWDQQIWEGNVQSRNQASRLELQKRKSTNLWNGPVDWSQHALFSLVILFYFSAAKLGQSQELIKEKSLTSWRHFCPINV